jgi:hypothetical protein
MVIPVQIVRDAKADSQDIMLLVDPTGRSLGPDDFR